MTGQTAHRPSESNHEWVMTRDGQRVRNTAYNGKSAGNNQEGAKTASRTSVMDAAAASSRDRDEPETELETPKRPEPEPLKRQPRREEPTAPRRTEPIDEDPPPEGKEERQEDDEDEQPLDDDKMSKVAVGLMAGQALGLGRRSGGRGRFRRWRQKRKQKGIQENWDEGVINNVKKFFKTLFG